MHLRLTYDQLMESYIYVCFTDNTISRNFTTNVPRIIIYDQLLTTNRFSKLISRKAYITTK